jgi:integrase/recombinase XerD
VPAEQEKQQIINEYLKALEVEVNPSWSYQIITRKVLTKLAQFHDVKSFTNMDREDVLSYLNSLRKSDKMHSWIGTYNLHLVILIRFFKWLYNLNSEVNQRPKPEVVQNIPQLKRKEVSIYKPSDLWTLEDDLVFLKYCPSARDRCYLAISRDLSARPHEILDLKIKDIIFKSAGNKQYAEVLVNGKTGTRHLPLIDSLPYVKEWSDQHPRRNDSNSYFICSLDRKNFAKQMSLRGLQGVFKRYKDNYYLPLSKDSSVPNEDRQRIMDLLQKPWNPYIRRHSALTQKSAILKEHTLRQHAGWSPRSQMHLKYLHYYGNESSNSLLQEYGILPKDNEETDVLKPKQCPNCNEPNRPDQKFCVKCQLALTFDAHIEGQDEIASLRAEMEDMRLAQRELQVLLRDPEQLKKMLES